MRRTLVAVVFAFAACGEDNAENASPGVGGAPSGGSAGSGAVALAGWTAGGTNAGSGGATTAGAAGLSAGGGAITGAAGGGALGGSAGSSATAGGAAGRSGTTTYHPCPTNGDPCKVLPFGDSITRGHKSSDDAGYRSRLFELFVAANQNVMFTGSLKNGPTQVSGHAFPRTHEGHAGWTIDPGSSPSYGGISSLVPRPALDGSPHIILLHIGTNDLFFEDSANMAKRLEVLVNDLAQNAPSALIVLAKITPLGSASTALTEYNDQISGIVQSHAAKGHHIIGVDMSRLPVPAGLDKDRVHPSDQGYAYMADVWYAAIEDLLPNDQTFSRD